MEWFHILLLKTLPLVELIIAVLILPSSFSLGWVSKKKSGLLHWLIKASQRGEGGNIRATSASHAHLFHSLLLPCSFSYTAGLKWPLSPNLIPSSDLLLNGIIPTEQPVSPCPMTFSASTECPWTATSYFTTCHETDKAFALCSQMSLSDPLHSL